MAKYVALLRGINVGRAKAVPMAALARVFEQLGYSDVTTLLRSGNVVFDSAEALGADAAASVEDAVLAATGVQSSVIILDAPAFRAIADANPLLDVATDGSKSFVTFLASPNILASPNDLADAAPTLVEPDAAALAPEILRVGEHAIYQWIPGGAMDTGVRPSFWKQFATPVTTRNWNTVLKLLALLG